MKQRFTTLMTHKNDGCKLGLTLIINTATDQCMRDHLRSCVHDGVVDTLNTVKRMFTCMIH